jgi:hypothetical protein
MQEIVGFVFGFYPFLHSTHSLVGRIPSLLGLTQVSRPIIDTFCFYLSRELSGKVSFWIWSCSLVGVSGLQMDAADLIPFGSCSQG